MQEAQNMIAREYSLFMSAKKRDFVTAFADLFSDEPDEKINTFVAVDNNSLVSSTGNILATIRIAFGDTAKQPPLEALELIDVIHRNCGHGWPHEAAGPPSFQAGDERKACLCRPVVDVGRGRRRVCFSLS